MAFSSADDTGLTHWWHSLCRLVFRRLILRQRRSDMSLLDIETQKAFDKMTPVAEAGNSASSAIHKAILSMEVTRKIADFLHGTWLGHPLHPVLTDFTVGA